MKVSGLKTLVLGLGRSGIAAAELLLSQGAQVAAVDDKEEKELKAGLRKMRRKGIEIRTGGRGIGEVENIDLLVVSPGVPVSHPLIQSAKSKGAPVIGELELAFRFCRSPLIAVTGTNGKSTTTALINHILKTAGRDSIAVGNIGIPFSSAVPIEGRPVVLEVSSYQLETVETFKPDIAVWLNLTPDHLGRHGELEDYGLMKARIFARQTADDTLVYNADDELVAGYCAAAESAKFPFSRKGTTGTFLENGRITCDWKGVKGNVLPVDGLRIAGAHNIENAMAATSAAVAFGIDLGLIADGLRTFAGIEHRQEKVAVCEGVTFVNDSKATNLDSGLKALKTVKAPIILIAGGRGKGESFIPAAELISDKVRLLIAIGEAAPQIKRELSGAAETVSAGDMAEALEIAWVNAVAGDTILLSPMCASFDMYEDFEERGRVFKSCVKRLVDAAEQR